IQKQFFRVLQSDYRKAHFSWRLLHDPEQRVRIMGERFKSLIYDTDPFLIIQEIFSRTSHLERLDQFLVVDGLTWLPDDILVKTDRSFMLNGMEPRCPFLNHLLAEFLAGVPARLKLKGFTDKYLLRKAMKDLLPAD